MKKCVILLAIVLFSASSALAYTTPLHKLGAGIKDVVTGPFKIFTVPVETMKNESDKTLSFLGGMMEGAAQSAIIPLNGIFKIVTFPFVNHRYEDE